VEKFYSAEQATEDNMAQAHCMLDTQGYKNTLRIYNIYCFSTATIPARKRFNISYSVIVLTLCDSPIQCGILIPSLHKP